jgi:hypothetical protein
VVREPFVKGNAREMEAGPLKSAKHEEAAPTLVQRGRYKVAVSLLRFRHFLVRAIYEDGEILRALSGTAIGLLFACIILTVVPLNVFTQSDWKMSEVHLASAGVIGTALALVLTFSLVPAQKAADAFTAEIVKLYARDWRVSGVFTLLSALTLLSLLLGTNWIREQSARYSLALQFLLLGSALDALRYFYYRMIALLLPTSALQLVLNDCEVLIKKEKRRIAQVARAYGVLAHQLQDAELRWILHLNSKGHLKLRAWNGQLEEFVHKAISRGDTQAASEAIGTMISVGLTYATSRQDSMVLHTDFARAFPVSESDVSNVLNPIYESLRNLCDNAIRSNREGVAISCIAGLGNAAVEAVTSLTVSSDSIRTAPLAFAPTHYIGACSNAAAAAAMDDALLAAIRAIGRILHSMPEDLVQSEIEAEGLDHLMAIAASSYRSDAAVVPFGAVRAMLAAAHREIRSAHGSTDVLAKVLNNVSQLMPLEVEMDRQQKRILLTFPPYELGSKLSIPALVGIKIAALQPSEKVERWANPYSGLIDVVDVVSGHYRKLGRTVTFQGALLQKWTLDSLFDTAVLLVQTIETPIAGGEEYLDVLEEELLGLLGAVAFYFSGDAFTAHYVAEACGRVADIALYLLELNRRDASRVCSQQVIQIADYAYANAKSEWVVAEIVARLELIRLGAEALGAKELAAEVHAAMGNLAVAESERPRYESAIQTRLQQMDHRLRRRDRYATREKAVVRLRRILERTGANAGHA